MERPSNRMSSRVLPARRQGVSRCHRGHRRVALAALRSLPGSHRRGPARRRAAGVGTRSTFRSRPACDLGNRPCTGRRAGAANPLAALASQPLDRKHPLWQLHVFEDYAGGTIVFSRIQHCMADGFALMHVALSLCDSTNGAAYSTRRRPARSFATTGTNFCTIRHAHLTSHASPQATPSLPRDCCSCEPIRIRHCAPARGREDLAGQSPSRCPR